MDSAKSVVFLDKVLMGVCPQNSRGVELFNMNLIRDLAGLGYKLVVPAHPTWHVAIAQKAGQNKVELISSSSGLGMFWIFQLCLDSRRRKFDILLQGNVANRLVPALVFLRLFRAAGRSILIAHREPSRRCLWVQRLWRAAVIAVNRIIAGRFEQCGLPEVSVYYGITDAAAFYPAAQHRNDGYINFCVAGRLDNAWKGGDTAVSAFCRLPPDIRGKCQLHLASFQVRPDFDIPGVVVYPWMSAEDMPEFFRSMDVMIVPSRDEGVMRETFSQVMVQGMLCGLPVLASRLPVLEEKLDTGGGLVFDSEQGLCEAMVQLVGDSEKRRRMGKISRKTALERYVWDTKVFADRFIEVTAESGGTRSG